MNAHNSWGCAKTKTRRQEFGTFVCQGPTAVSQGVHQQAAGIGSKAGTQDPVTLIWDMGMASGTFTTAANALSRILSQLDIRSRSSVFSHQRPPSGLCQVSISMEPLLSAQQPREGGRKWEVRWKPRSSHDLIPEVRSHVLYLLVRSHVLHLFF